MHNNIKMSNTKNKNEIHLRSPGPVLPGSISTAMARCGKKICKCHGNPAYRHGPYYRWTGFIEGKKTTVTLTKEEAGECKKRIKNFKTLQTALAKIIQAAIETAPWTER